MTRSIYRSLRTLSYREKEIRKQKFPKFSSTLTGKVQLLSFGLFAVAFLSVFAYYLSKVELIKTISIFTLLLAYIVNISQPIFALFENRKSIARFIDNPLIKYFESAEETSYIRARYIRYLARKPLHDIKLVLSQLEEEKSEGLVGNDSSSTASTTVPTHPQGLAGHDNSSTASTTVPPSPPGICRQ